MKTKYQKVLHALSLLQKVSKKEESQEVIQCLFDFLDEVKEDIASGIELKQVAALEKLRNVKEIIDQMKEEDFDGLRKIELPEELQEIDRDIKGQIKTKLDGVMQAIDKHMRK